VNRYLIAFAVGLCLACALAASAQAGAMGLAKLGIGAYGVTNIPVVQDDAESGALYGIRARLGVLSALAIEPSISFIKSGDAEVDYDVEGLEGQTLTIEGPDMTSFAVNLVWGGAAYGTAGIGVTSLDLHQPGLDSTSETTYNFGGGAEIAAGPVSIDLSARLYVINNVDKASRKSLAIMAGVNYYIF